MLERKKKMMMTMMRRTNTKVRLVSNLAPIPPYSSLYRMRVHIVVIRMSIVVIIPEPHPTH